VDADEQDLEKVGHQDSLNAGDGAEPVGGEPGGERGQVGMDACGAGEQGA
jgi:hypothetical protein